MNSKRKIVLTYMMSIFLVLPFLSGILDIGILFLLLSMVFAAAGWIKSEHKNIFSLISCWKVIGIVGLLGGLLIGAVLKIVGITSGGGHQSGEFLVVISVLFLYASFCISPGWIKDGIEIPTFIGLWFLMVYLVDAGVFPEILSIFKKGEETFLYTNMLAYLVFQMAAGLYIYMEDRKMQPIYVAAMVISALVLAINEAWGTAFTILVVLILYATVIEPIAATIKHLLQVFFGLALIFCNMSLLINYTGIMHIEGLQYHLECSLTGELFLCLLATYVFKRWEKIPEGVDLRRIKLTKFQKGCRFFLKKLLYLLVILIILSVISGKMKEETLVQILAGEKWESVSRNVFVVAATSLISHMYEALVEFKKGNLFYTLFQMYGLSGGVLGILGIGVLCYRSYITIQKTQEAEGLKKWLTLSILVAMVCLPVMVYMLPLYLIVLFSGILSEVTIPKWK